MPPNTTNLNSFTILFTKSFTKKIKKWEPLNDDIKNVEIWAGGIAQRLRTLFTQRTQVRVPAHTQQLTNVCNSSSRKCNVLLWPPWAPGTYMVYRHTHRWNTHQSKKYCWNKMMLLSESLDRNLYVRHIGKEAKQKKNPPGIYISKKSGMNTKWYIITHYEH